MEVCKSGSVATDKPVEPTHWCSYTGREIYPTTPGGFCAKVKVIACLLFYNMRIWENTILWSYFHL